MNCQKIQYETNKKCPRGKTGLYYTQGHILQVTKDKVVDKPPPPKVEGYKPYMCKP